MPCFRSSGLRAAIKRADLLVDRADAAELVIVFGDFEHPLARHIASSEHIFQKRHDIVRVLPDRRTPPPVSHRVSSAMPFTAADCLMNGHVDESPGTQSFRHGVLEHIRLTV